MKKLLLFVLLIVGCVHWQPTVWEIGIEHSEFVAQNDELNLWKATADTIVYTRADEYYYWNSKPYHWYVFAEGKLVEVKKGMYRSKLDHPQKVEIRLEKD